jgi:tetratricopeptide (TPR) repeat protein
MAVLVEGISVVVRRGVIMRRYPRGWLKFMVDAPNKTLCADSELARIGFMHPDDVGAFVRRLEGLGFVFLDQQGSAVDIVVVDQLEGPTTPCSWLEFFHEQVPGGGAVAAARLVGSEDGTLICPDDWEYERSLSAQFKFYPGGQSDELALSRRESNMDVFRNRFSDEEEFVARTRDHDAGFDEGAIEHVREEHNALYQSAIELIEPFLVTHVQSGDPRPAKSNGDQSKLRRAGELLEKVINLREDNWNAWWLLGMTYRFRGASDSARFAFKRAFEIAPTEIEVGRNLALESIALGHGPEAVDVTTKMVKLSPDDAGLIANRALALLINGDVTSAQIEAERALNMNPSDTVTSDLYKLIEAVRDGHVAAPSKWPPE